MESMLPLGQSQAETRIETYIPLYRKYRPQSFADVVGQEPVVQTLANAINQHKVAHAYLFCGPRGTGKTSIARILAKSLNCEQGPTLTPCLSCAVCTGIADGNALDVIEFDAASNNGVEDARELIENCQYSPMSGRYKIYIIDEVHMLSNSAFNALLKTLEEPPPNVIFIFATTEAHKVLPTIISRCQRFDFHRIQTGNIVDRLKAVASHEGIRIEEEALHLIARHSRGGMRDAVGLLDQVGVLSVAQPDTVISAKDVALFIGSLEEETLLRISGAIAEKRSADLIQALNELVNRGVEPVQLLKELAFHFRSLLLVQIAHNTPTETLAGQLSLPADYVDALKEQSGLFGEPEELPQIISRLSGIERNIRHTQQPQLWLEMGLIELAYRHDIHLVKTLAERVEQLEQQLQNGAPALAQPKPQAMAKPLPQAAPRQNSAPTIPQTAQPFAAPPAIEMPAQTQPTQTTFTQPFQAQSAAANPLPQPANQSLDASYRQICESVASPPVKSMLRDFSFPMSLDNDTLRIGVTNEQYLQRLQDPKRLVHVQKAVDRFFGKPITLQLAFNAHRPADNALPTAAMPASPQQTFAPPPAAVDEPPKPEQAAALASAPMQEPPSATLQPEPMEAEFEEGPVEAQASAAPEASISSEAPEPAPVQPTSELPPATPAALSSVETYELEEAKKYTMDLLQGQIIEER